jgi:hypothetical protein
MATPTRDKEYENRKEKGKKLIAAGGCAAIKFWSNTDAIRLCPDEHKNELDFRPLEAPIYISEWIEEAKKAIKLIYEGVALIARDWKSPETESPSSIEGEDGWAVAFKFRNMLAEIYDELHGRGKICSDIEDLFAEYPPRESPSPALPVTLKIIVNGQPIDIQVSGSDTILSIMEKALVQTHSTGRPVSDWTMRTHSGEALDKTYTVDDLEEKDGNVLFLSLNAGIGASPTLPIATANDRIAALTSENADLKAQIKDLKDWIDSHK